MEIRRLFTKHQFAEGSRLPWWLGVAYWQLHVNEAVCYPIPLNLFVRYAHTVYFWAKKTQDPDWLTRQLEKTHRAAFRAGFDAGKMHVEKILDDTLARMYPPRN